MGPQLEALAKDHPEVSLRRVDIRSWQSEVAGQHGIRQLPTLWLYEDGRRIATDRQQVAERLARLGNGAGSGNGK